MNKLLGVFSSLVLVVLLGNSDAFAQRCCSMHQRATRNYNPATVETLAGTVEEVGTFRMGGVHAVVRTGKGTIDVHLGPGDYLNEKIKLAAGDRITVTGSRVAFNGADVILARSITRAGVTVVLRNDDGTPKWTGRGKGYRCC